MRRTASLVSGLVVLALLLSVLPLSAQTPGQPSSGFGAGQGVVRQTAEGGWYLETGAGLPAEEQVALPQAVGPQAIHGPDAFGYTWDDAAAFEWADATSGTAVDFGGAKSTGVDLPFGFRYYENTYDMVYIGEDGYLSFASPPDMSQGELPSPTPPNDVIAPYWNRLTLDAAGTTARVYTDSDLGAADPYFVVEWYQVKSSNPGGVGEGNDVLTFEVILFESGKIQFQYDTFDFGGNGSDNCGSAGIENSTGQIGLTSIEYCGVPAEASADSFSPPEPGARIGILREHQGRFTQPGGAESFTVQVENWGNDDDEFLLAWQASPAAGWINVGPLPDTTGVLAPGEPLSVPVNITAPAGAVAGDNVKVSVTVTSVSEPSVTKSATVQVAIPTTLAQVFREDSVNAFNPMALYLASPTSETTKFSSSDYNLLSRWLAVDKLPNGSTIYLWIAPDDPDTTDQYVTFYSLYDAAGNVIGEPARRLYVDYTCGAGCVLHDNGVTVSAAPNGKIGVAWYRTENTSTGRRYNVHFALLNAAGNLEGSILNLTNNTLWRDSNGIDEPRIRHVRVAATDDSRFVVAWQWSNRVDDPDTTDVGADRDDQQEVHYAVVSGTGAVVKAKSRISAADDAPNTTGFSWPAIAPLNGNQAVVYWAKYGDDDIQYAVVGADNNASAPATFNQSTGNAGVGLEPWYLDAARLSDGKVFVAWAANTDCAPASRARYVVAGTGGTVGNPNLAPTCLATNGSAAAGGAFLSVAADANGRAMLSWANVDTKQQRDVFYALVANNGSIVSPPMPFLTTESNTRLLISETGYGIAGAAPAAATPPTAVNDSYVTSRGVPLVVAAPGVLANDLNPAGGTMTAQKVTNPGHGSVTLNANGSFTYTPAGQYTGSDSFTYRAVVGDLQSTPATVQITISAQQHKVYVPMAIR